MATIEVDDEVYRHIDHAAQGREMNQGLRDLLGLAPVETLETRKTAGELFGLVSAGLIASGDHLIATAPILSPEPVATVTDDARLRANDAIVYPGPAAFITNVRGGTFAPYGWQLLTTADGRNLSTLRQQLLARVAPHKLPVGPGVLMKLVANGLLTPGDQLQLPMHRRGGGRCAPIAIGTAIVTDDGCLLLPDGSRYPSLSAAAAALRGNPTGAWGAWAAPDGRRLAALRDLVRPRRATW